MRVLRSLESEAGLVTIYDWNEKYLIKFESDGFEQTYKIRKLDLIYEKDLDLIIGDKDFIRAIQNIFDQMFEQFGKAVTPYV